MSGDTVNMITAMEVADPWLAAVRRESGDGPSMDLNRRLREDAARVKVRRVVAALNGLDVRAMTSPDVDAGALPVVVDRALVDALKAAMCNEVVFAALIGVVGEAAAGDLVGAVSML